VSKSNYKMLCGPGDLTPGPTSYSPASATELQWGGCAVLPSGDRVLRRLPTSQLHHPLAWQA